MLDKLVEDFYDNCYATPLGKEELIQFAELVLNDFIKELESNKTTVIWNYGCDAVVFYNKNYDKKSVLTIKESYFGKSNNKSDSIELYGRGAEGADPSDQQDNLADE